MERNQLIWWISASGVKSEISFAFNDIKMAKGPAGPDIEETEVEIRMIKAWKAGPIWMGAFQVKKYLFGPQRSHL